MTTSSEEPDPTGIWEVLGCKWTFHILRYLDAEDARFNQLQDGIDGLPASTLSARLKGLQAENVIERTVDETATPPTVTYSLTEKGDELADLVARIEDLERRYD